MKCFSSRYSTMLCSVIESATLLANNTSNNCGNQAITIAYKPIKISRLASQDSGLPASAGEPRQQQWLVSLLTKASPVQCAQVPESGAQTGWRPPGHNHSLRRCPRAAARFRKPPIGTSERCCAVQGPQWAAAPDCQL